MKNDEQRGKKFERRKTKSLTSAVKGISLSNKLVVIRKKEIFKKINLDDNSNEIKKNKSKLNIGYENSSFFSIIIFIFTIIFIIL